MNLDRRRTVDRWFTGLTLFSVFVIALSLVGVLGPMVRQGASAVFFRGTVEFRKMQLERHGRGDAQEIEAEARAAEEARRPVYAMLDQFRRGVDPAPLMEEARSLCSEATRDIDLRSLPREARAAERRRARDLRDYVLDALAATDEASAREHLARALAFEGDASLAGPPGEGLLDLARRYGDILAGVDLSHRGQYKAALGEVQEAVRRLFGPKPGDKRPALAQDQYGVTRWDQALRNADNLLYAETWVSTGPGLPLVKKRVPREEQFAGTTLANLFPYVREHLTEMLRPRSTAYWNYFTDDSTPGHFFGGVGPEILGTLSLTLLAILCAFPLGVVAAAYLVEVGGESRFVHLLRMCINTLAGVPSIVFGLFGLAFIVLWLFPRLGLRGEPCTLAAALTLAALVLPVIIRASEEAIRAVPAAYKEAGLALGASRFRCFVTVQLPVALPGILTGVILSMSRAAGETAPILFAGAVALGPELDLGGWPPFEWLLRPTRALSYGSYDIAVGDRLAALVPHQQFGMVTTLVVLVLLLNLTAIIVRSRVARRLRGQ